jgi:hypothetical protein
VVFALWRVFSNPTRDEADTGGVARAIFLSTFVMIGRTGSRRSNKPKRIMISSLREELQSIRNSAGIHALTADIRRRGPNADWFDQPFGVSHDGGHATVDVQNVSVDVAGTSLARNTIAPRALRRDFGGVAAHPRGGLRVGGGAV